uniref:Matrix remodeling-associated protein 8 n=1 Tax=Cyprinus carpio TaxID=7962 RepID=A0A8C2D5R2_CYPCA
MNSLFFIEFSLGQNDGSGVVVATYNISAPQGSQAELQCHSQRMVWTQDRLKDRQRVVHWDLLRSSPDHAMERVIDMFSAFHIATITIPVTAFVPFFLRVNYVCILIYTCCWGFLSARKERRFWDGQKAVFVVLVGGTVALPCVNRRPIWTEGNSQEDQQQVVHWDRQPPGVRHDRADRLIDLYASGERRHYGPLFVQQKMNISATAFSQGDFSLTISDIQPLDQGLYSCHLHHHYCGLHERRIFQLTVMPPVPQITQEPTDEPQYLPNEEPSKRNTQSNKIKYEKHKFSKVHLFSFLYFNFLLIIYYTFTAHKGFSRILPIYHTEYVSKMVVSGIGSQLKLHVDKCQNVLVTIFAT